MLVNLAKTGSGESGSSSERNEDRGLTEKENEGDARVESASTRRRRTDARRRSDASIALALVDGRALTRASIRDLLARNAPEFCVYSFPSHDELLSDDLGGISQKPEVLIINLGREAPEEGALNGDLLRLHEALPDVPIALVSDGDTTAPAREALQCCLHALQCGVRAFLPTSLSPDIFVAALRLIHAGGTFVPPELMLAGLQPPVSSSPMPTSPVSISPVPISKEGQQSQEQEICYPALLTPRESEVLALLRLGKSNKVIASELAMQESTVKVHVRHIMRKLKVTNRTHAALIAFQASS